jgi:hypothetical protein
MHFPEDVIRLTASLFGLPPLLAGYLTSIDTGQTNVLALFEER